jgi:chromosome segregation ATPase
MSAKVDQFCDHLRDRLNTIDERLQSVKTNIRSLPDQAKKTLRHKLDAAQTRLQVLKERVEQTRANLKTQAQQQMAETEAAVSKLLATGETRRLNARADQAETDAAVAIDHAVASMGEVEEAILDAAVARMYTAR